MKKYKLLALGLCAAMVLSAVPAMAAEAGPKDMNTVDYVDNMIRDLAPADGDEPMVIAPAPDFDAPQGQYSLVVDGRETGVSIPVAVPLRTMAEALGFNVTWNGDGTTYVPLELLSILLGNLDSARLSFPDGVLSLTTEPARLQNVEISNPFVACAGLDEAAKLTGFSLTVPSAPDAVEVMDGSMIQARYENGVLIRKAAGSEDVSGDYNSYAQVISVDGVTLKGENGAFSLAVWAKDGYTYSISVDEALAQAELLALTAAVQ